MTDEEYLALVTATEIKPKIVEFLKKTKLFIPPDKNTMSLAIKVRLIFNSCRHRKAGGPLGRLKGKLDWFLDVTDFTVEQVEQTCQEYIEQCNRTKRFPLDAHNFVVAQEGSHSKNLLQSELYNLLTQGTGEIKQQSFTQIL